MVGTRSAKDIIEQDFLDLRHGILDVAATLDRIDRGRGRGEVADDPRLGQIGEALSVLRDGGVGRAERVQMVFSRGYDPAWRG